MHERIERHTSLAPRTTLGVGGEAEYFALVESEEELREVVTWATEEHLPLTVLGGGSNVLVADSGVKGLVVVPHIMSRSLRSEENDVYLTVGAGVVLDDLIQECVREGLWGIENLSGIPGTVGGVPIQNVGAYGVDASDVVHRVRVYDRETDTFRELRNEDCRFGYRDSLFKREGKGRYIITSVTVGLSRTPKPTLSYRDIRERFQNEENPSLSLIRDAVIDIRKAKFPDWRELGTAGSFFKNPIVSQEVRDTLTLSYPGLPSYEEHDGRFKIALGWILDKVLHLKGYREGNVGLYSEQALVLVNYGGTATEIYTFSERIIEKIFSATGLTVEREVGIVS